MAFNTRRHGHPRLDDPRCPRPRPQWPWGTRTECPKSVTNRRPRPRNQQIQAVARAALPIQNCFFLCWFHCLNYLSHQDESHGVRSSWFYWKKELALVLPGHGFIQKQTSSASSGTRWPNWAKWRTAARPFCPKTCLSKGDRNKIWNPHGSSTYARYLLRSTSTISPLSLNSPSQTRSKKH